MDDNQINLILLRKALIKHFNISDLRTLCFDLRIEYENLPGETHDDKVRELIEHCIRHGQLEELITYCKENRPRIDWSNIIPDQIQEIQISDQNLDTSSATISFPQTSSPKEFTLLSLRDVSHGLAKRYSANILISVSFSKEDIIQAVRNATNNLKSREYYRNEIVDKRWRRVPAQVVFLFVYRSLEDIRTTNWICRSLWIDSKLPAEFSPIPLKGEDIGDGIIVDWSTRYESFRKLYSRFELIKEDYLAQLNSILQPLSALINKAIELTDRFEANSINDKNYLQEMVKLESPVLKLYMQATNIGLAPIECKDLSERFQSFAGNAHNIVLPYSENGLRTWDGNNRKHIVKRAIENYKNDFTRLEFELEKIR